MDADRLYVSERSASEAATKAIESKKADRFVVQPRRLRNEDRTVSQGFVALLTLGGRPVGYA